MKEPKVTVECVGEIDTRLIPEHVRMDTKKPRQVRTHLTGQATQ